MRLLIVISVIVIILGVAYYFLIYKNKNGLSSGSSKVVVNNSKPDCDPLYNIVFQNGFQKNIADAKHDEAKIKYEDLMSNPPMLGGFSSWTAAVAKAKSDMTYWSSESERLGKIVEDSKKSLQALGCVI